MHKTSSACSLASNSTDSSHIGEAIRVSECELDCTSIAFINNYENFFKPFLSPHRSNMSYLEASCRVVSICELRALEQNTKRPLYEYEFLCSGTVGEMPTVFNYNRYLVFFDNGMVSYARHLFPIFELFTLPTDRLHVDHVRFIEHYMSEYPDRDMILVKQPYHLNVFFNGAWRYQACVTDTDGALVEITFPGGSELAGNRARQAQFVESPRNPFSIWIYRGSFCIQQVVENAIHVVKNAQNTSKVKSFFRYVYERYHSTQPVELARLSKGLLSVFASTSLPYTLPNQDKFGKPYNRQRERLNIFMFETNEYSNFSHN